MVLTDYHKRYKSEISDYYENLYDIEIFEHNDYAYSGPDPEPFICSGKPVIIRQKATENLIGSTCELTIKSFEELKFLNLFSRREGDYILRITGKNFFFRWIGIIVPGYYSEDFSDPPFDVKINAVDGLGRLKEIYAEDNENEVVLGSNNWDRFTEALHKCSVIKYILVQNVFENVVNDFYDIMTTDYLLQEKNTKKKSFYEFVLEFCRTFDFKLLQYNEAWMLYNGVLEDDVSLTPFNLYTGSWEAPLTFDFIKSLNSRVFAGGTLSIIPPLSTVDVVWSRNSYNVGSASALYNSEFLDDFDGWTYKGTWFQQEIFPLQSGPPLVINDSPPTFHSDVDGKTGILSLRSYAYMRPGIGILAGQMFTLKSLPLTLVNPGVKIDLRFHYYPYLTEEYEIDDYDGMYAFLGFVTFEGVSGQSYQLRCNEYNDFEHQWIEVPNNLSEPDEYVYNYVDMAASNSWSDMTALEGVMIPEAGEVTVTIGGFPHVVGSVGFGVYLHEVILEVLSLNADGEWVPEYHEILRFQSDVKGFTENKTIELQLANKYESLADGNLFVDNGGDQPESAGEFEFNSIQERIQELLIYRIVNARKKALESISVDIEGIIPGVCVLEDVPGRPGKRFYSEEIELSLREFKTTGKFSEADLTFEQIDVTVYSNERKLLTKTVG